MTPEQRQIITDVMAMGITCGLSHPFEWIANATEGQALSVLPYYQVEGYVVSVYDAFTALYAETAPYPEDEPFTREMLIDMMNAYYARGQKTSIHDGRVAQFWTSGLDYYWMFSDDREYRRTMAERQAKFDADPENFGGESGREEYDHWSHRSSLWDGIVKFWAPFKGKKVRVTVEVLDG